jgi:hypothetical protein
MIKILPSVPGPSICVLKLVILKYIIYFWYIFDLITIFSQMQDKDFFHKFGA